MNRKTNNRIFPFAFSHQTATVFHLRSVFFFSYFCYALALGCGCGPSSTSGSLHEHASCVSVLCPSDNLQLSIIHPSVKVERERADGRRPSRKNWIGITLFEPNLFRLHFRFCFVSPRSALQFSVSGFLSTYSNGYHAYISSTIIIYIKLALMK